MSFVVTDGIGGQLIVTDGLGGEAEVCLPVVWLEASVSAVAYEEIVCGCEPGNSGGGEETPPPQMGPVGYIFRFFESIDLENIRNGTVDYGHFDGFFWNPVFSSDEQANLPTALELVKQGKKYHGLTSNINFGLVAHTNSWNTWLRDNIQASARYVNGATAGQVSYECVPVGDACGNLQEFRELINYAALTPIQIAQMAQKIVTLFPDNVFHDQVFLEPPWYFWCGEPGAVPGICVGLTCRSCFQGQAYTAAGRAQFESLFPQAAANQVLLINAVKAFLEARGNWALCNGEPNIENETVHGLTVPRPIYLQNMQQGAGLKPFAITRWRDHPKNVCTISIPPFPQPIPLAFQVLKNEFAVNGGWVGVDGSAADNQNIQSCYAQLNAVRPTGLPGAAIPGSTATTAPATIREGLV